MKARIGSRRAICYLCQSVLFLWPPAAGAQAGCGYRFEPYGLKDLEQDSYVAFRIEFNLGADAEVEFRTLGASWFVAWLDGDYFTEGPARFHKEYPQYDTSKERLSAGTHVLAVQLHHLGLITRILKDMPSFFSCQIVAGDKPVPAQWKCKKLKGYKRQVRRINPQLGWIEWCDTRELPEGWKRSDFDDTGWDEPVGVDPGIGAPKPVSIGRVQSFIHPIRHTAAGPLAESFGYEFDDVPARFFLRDLKCDKLPPGGLWRRYDLGRVRLGRLRFVLELPPGAIVEFTYSEALSHGRVSPYITLSSGASCNLDHYVARGGPQEFFPLTPKGGRFIEIHVLGDPSRIRFVKEEFVERCYHGQPQGSFACQDELLNRIWLAGIETYRGCTEDAVIDNPTRERGQWTGDVVTVGMDIAGVGYSDLRLLRRGLIQSAQGAREDGLVAGLTPGGPTHPVTYAAQWVSACLHYWELTGDVELLEQMFSYARRNIEAFEKYMTEDGLRDGLSWAFVDWGYVRNSGPSDMACNLHLLAAVRDMVRWCRQLERDELVGQYESLEHRLTRILDGWFQEQLIEGETGWEKIGYHRAVLGLRMGFFKSEQAEDCVAHIKRHILNCFPNDPSAPRNSDPALQQPRLITPYFAHYAFPVLIECGEMRFVLNQFRKCWGWALEQSPTWIEVFDTRWSHCHQWAGCPTWQLSRYVLGLHTRFDLGDRHFVLLPATGGLNQAEGAIPLPGSEGVIEVKWQKKADGLHYRLTTPVPIHLHLDKTLAADLGEVICIEREFSHVFPSEECWK